LEVARLVLTKHEEFVGAKPGTFCHARNVVRLAREYKNEFWLDTEIEKTAIDRATWEIEDEP
jgi:hypothetical protein